MQLGYVIIRFSRAGEVMRGRDVGANSLRQALSPVVLKDTPSDKVRACFQTNDK